MENKKGDCVMAGLNKVMIIGNLGRDPELKYSQASTAVCSLNLAASEKWKDKEGNQQEKTEWVRAVSFGKQAEVLEKYLSKGSQVYIEGRLQTRNYEKDGQTHYTTEVVVKDFVFLGGGQQKDQPQQQGYRQPPQGNQQQYQPPQGNTLIPDDDIPF
jgi:single-strand DNA-binding protein